MLYRISVVGHNYIRKFELFDYIRISIFVLLLLLLFSILVRV